MTLEEFINKYKGTTVGDGQCVYLIRQYSEEVLQIGFSASGNAYQFYTLYDLNSFLKNNFERISYSTSNLPKKGDIIVWNTKVGSGNGHVAIFQGLINEKTFLSFDQNWNKPNISESTVHDFTNIYGYLRPKEKQGTNQGTNSEITLKKKKYKFLLFSKRSWKR